MKPINWGGQEAADPRFLTIVKEWIETDGEIYVRIYYAKAGGATDHGYFNTYSQFAKTINSTRGNCSIEVYRHPQFTIRGIITEEFISTAKNVFDESKEWFLLILEKNDGGWRTISAFGDNTPQNLDMELRGFQGSYALIGPDIHWPVPPDDYPGEWVQANIDGFNRKDEISSDSAS